MKWLFSKKIQVVPHYQHCHPECTQPLSSAVPFHVCTYISHTSLISDILKSSLQLRLCLHSSTQCPLGASWLRIWPCYTLPWYMAPQPPKLYILHTYKISITCSLPPWAMAVSASVCWPQGSTPFLRGSREPLELNLGLHKMEWVSYGCLQDTLPIAPA